VNVSDVGSSAMSSSVSRETMFAIAERAIAGFARDIRSLTAVDPPAIRGPRAAGRCTEDCRTNPASDGSFWETAGARGTPGDAASHGSGGCIGTARGQRSFISSTSPAPRAVADWCSWLGLSFHESWRRDRQWGLKADHVRGSELGLVALAANERPEVAVGDPGSRRSGRSRGGRGTDRPGR
jgi:hypothetical protein